MRNKKILIDYLTDEESDEETSPINDKQPKIKLQNVCFQGISSSLSKQVLRLRLPKTIWVGSRFHSQKAILCDNEHMEYVMENHTPTTVPQNVLHFDSYYELKNWVDSICLKSNELEHDIFLLEKITILTEIFNKEFPNNQLPLIDNVQIPDVNTWKIKSIITFFTEIRNAICQNLNPHVNRIKRFLSSNELMGDVTNLEQLNENILTTNIGNFKNKLSTWYKTLNIHYRKKLDKCNIVSALSLSSRTNIPILACHMFLQQVDKISDEERHKKAMRERWLNNN
tara:strand:+ start:53154 stop:54002 length:849 start_codon:yes stop_codon:yes gene_type:complete